MEQIGLIVGVVAGVAAILAAGHAVWRRVYPARQAAIYLANGTENAGRYLRLQGRLPRPHRGSSYWIAVQPSICRAEDSWWPQAHPIRAARDGSWTLDVVRLGRDGNHDGGVLFTIALFEVSGDITDAFARSVQDDAPIGGSPRWHRLDAVEVRRVEPIRYL